MLLGAGRWKFRGHYLLFSALGMTLLGMLMTGSRGPVLILALLFPVYWWLAVIREKGGGAVFGRLVIALALVLGFIAYTSQDAVDAFLGRVNTGGADVQGRIASPLQSPFLVMSDVGVAGYGIGSTHQTAAALTPGIVPYSWLHGLIVEVESGRVMIELGPIGFFLVYFVRIFLALYAFLQVLALRTRFHRAIATASLLFFLAAIPGGVVFDVTSDLFYWFFAGLLLTAVRLDRDPLPKAAGAATAAPRAALQRRPEPALPAAR
jgi:hypothetical protein